MAAPHVICGDFDSILPSTKSFFERHSRMVEMKDDDTTDLTNALRLLRQSDEFKKGQVSIYATIAVT